MYLVTSILAALICYVTKVFAAPPSATAPNLVPLEPISQISNYTIGIPNVSASPTSFEPCRMTSRAEKYTMNVRGTRTTLEIVLCIDLPINPDALQDTLLSAINIFHDRLAAQGDGFIEPDPWYAPRVEGRDCGLAVKSDEDKSTLTYQVGVDALLGLFKFYKTIKIYTSSLTVVFDKSLAEADRDVGVIVLGPFDL